MRSYDTDDTDAISHIELTSMLDSLSSTPSAPCSPATTCTVSSQNMDRSHIGDKLSIEEVTQTLDEELGRPDSEKRRVNEGRGMGAGTSVVQTPVGDRDAKAGKLDLDKMDFLGPPHVQLGYGTQPAEVPLDAAAAGVSADASTGTGQIRMPQAEWKADVLDNFSSHY